MKSRRLLLSAMLLTTTVAISFGGQAQSQESGGAHVNAVGADAEGKEEIEPAVLKEARVIVDDVTQAGAAGEINVPVAQGLFSESDIYATLAELVTGAKQGRGDDADITVFDATGVAIEDVAVASVLYKKAMERGEYPSLDLLGF